MAKKKDSSTENQTTTDQTQAEQPVRTDEPSLLSPEQQALAGADASTPDQTPATEQPTPDQTPATEQTTSEAPAPQAEGITLTMSGTLSGSYVGPAGRSLKDMFPALGGAKKHQVRFGGHLVKIDEPWNRGSGEVKVVEHARHG